MNTTIKKIKSLDKKKNFVLICRDSDKTLSNFLSDQEITFLKNEWKSDREIVAIQKPNARVWVVKIKDQKQAHLTFEKIRKLGNTLGQSINRLNIKSIQLITSSEKSIDILAMCEGMVLGNYQFLKYFSDKKKRKNSLEQISVIDKNITSLALKELSNVCSGTSYARDLVNEPLSFLTAPQISKEMEKLGKEAGFSVDVFKKKKIESLKLGGLLAVNQGSVDPPTFTVMEWKPSKCKNKKPIVLVGKGVVYDTGGLSLKPTKGSMDEMKCDMGGAAAVIGAMYSIASNKLPVHVIALVPATDNRPGLNAYVPGDVVEMHNGMTVEVLNTDAEGRMLLADALSYARRYKPELVMDLATLTGAAHRAVGTHASVIMGSADDSVFETMEKSGEQTYERTLRFPLWSEYGEMIESDIADLKNIGGALAGATTAGKFLEHFTKDKPGTEGYPWIHLDIAGPAFLDSRDGYRTVGGTGVGVRLLYQFIKSQYCND